MKNVNLDIKAIGENMEFQIRIVLFGIIKLISFKLKSEYCEKNEMA